MRIVVSVIMAAVLATTAAGQSAQQAAPAPKPEAIPKNDANPFTPLEVLSDTQGVDFQPYLRKVLTKIRNNWYNLIPPEARKPELKQGKVSIEFVILPKGTIAAMKITHPSGDIALDRAAWGGITASVPFAPLPEQFRAFTLITTRHPRQPTDPPPRTYSRIRLEFPVLHFSRPSRLQNCTTILSSESGDLPAEVLS